jgi:peptide/nickel transport system ATP-binding protein/oligopeptide transport system ATP-binding protein
MIMTETRTDATLTRTGRRGSRGPVNRDEVLLEIKDLRVTFQRRGGPATAAVDGVSFSVKPGEIVGVVGESGSGKSVTALSVMRLIDETGHIAEETRVFFDGRDLATLSETEMEHIRGDDISMIFQEPMTSLNPVYTCGEQIAEVVRCHRNVNAKEAAERAVEMLELVGIPEAARRANDYPHQLSGGMRQRVMIAIALACDPKLLIADEPTTALDVTIQAQILELMTELRERLGMAMMLITHDLGVVAEMCDDVVVMYAGRVVERGPVDEVFTSPQHPYTEALLQSIPMLGMTQAEPLRVIRGTVPSPLDWPVGCRFQPRCDYAFEKCVEEHPPLFPVDRQQSACWLCEHGRRVPAPPQTVEAP